MKITEAYTNNRQFLRKPLVFYIIKSILMDNLKNITTFTSLKTMSVKDCLLFVKIFFATSTFTRFTQIM